MSVRESKPPTDQSFTTSIILDQSPMEVFDAINNIRGWWSEQVEGKTDELNAEFLYHFKSIHICKMKIVEFIPNRKVVWLVLENHFSFVSDTREWKDTKISFEIQQKEGKTQLLFTHIGLVPQYECYQICHEAWSNYVHNSLRSLINTGKGQPNPKEGDGYNSALVEKWKLNQ